jgi:hypothetical protein
MLDTVVIMQVGQVGFHKQGDVLKVKAVEKKGDILKKINKTLVEAHPDLEEQRKEYDRRIAKESKRQAQACSNLQMHVLKEAVYDRTLRYRCAHHILMWQHSWHNQVISVKAGRHAFIQCVECLADKESGGKGIDRKEAQRGGRQELCDNDGRG